MVADLYLLVSAIFKTLLLGIISKPFVIPLIIESLSRWVSRLSIQACQLSGDVIMACGSIRSHAGAQLDAHALDDPASNLAPSKHVEIGSLAKGFRLTN